MKRSACLQNDAVADPPSAELFRACWTVDLSAVRPLIEEAAGDGSKPADWVELLLHGARIADLDEPAAQVVGSPVGRDRMIGQPVAFCAPPDSWVTLATLIVRVASDRPQHALRSSRINSFMLAGATLKVWGAAGDFVPERIQVAVEGVLSDDRSPWAVRASEQRYRRLIHHLPNALLQVDARPLGALFQRLRGEGIFDLQAHIGRNPDFLGMARRLVEITDANLGAAQLFGAGDAAALIGTADPLFAAAPDTARKVIIAHFNGERSFAERMKVRTFDSRVLDVQLSVTYPMPPERLDVTLISLEDVTERLRTEAELRQLQADYTRAARIALLGELASSIAHEVNQPLAAIAMNAQTSLRWLSRDKPKLAKVTELTGRIADSACHASEIVQRVRGMAGSRAPERIRLDLNSVVKEALFFVQHDLECRSIALLEEFPSELPAVLGDRVQLQQVVVNLLVNSIQAIVQAGRERGKIKVATRREADGSASFMIQDNGSGVPVEHLDRVLEGFFNTKPDGMGIGLSVCQSIIAVHGGVIAAGNSANGGAVFGFTLPAMADPPASPPDGFRPVPADAACARG